ncbi:MAG: phosphonate C-P lyase system protein PhnG [Clostridium butyricum]|nr:phosphonate C-P lyase system protein PhnG [Clostridium butyricum]
MNRRRRTEILIRGSKELAEKLAKKIEEKYDIRTIDEPNNGLVMIKMRETAKKQLFYLGEVLVTEAKININGHLGMGIVVGDNEELAVNLAIIDGAYKANLKEIDAWEELLLNEEKLIKEKEDKLSQKILETKVDFTTMNS